MKKVNRYISAKTTAFEMKVERQRELKVILVQISNGAKVAPAIYKIEQMYAKPR